MQDDNKQVISVGDVAMIEEDVEVVAKIMLEDGIGREADVR